MRRFNIADIVRSLFSQKSTEETKDPYKSENFTWTDLKDEPRTKKRGLAHGTRKWSQITGICLHQTAVDFGTNPKRLLNVPVHGATLKDGHIILLHDPKDYMWHAHSLNKTTIGIEVSCRAAGLLEEAKTFWRSKREKEQGKTYEQLVKEATDIQLAATKELCRYYIEMAKKNGGEIKYIQSHRQGHSSRVSDPGERIWKEVAIPIMKEFNLTTGPYRGYKIGSGNSLPIEWDADNGTVKY